MNKIFRIALVALVALFTANTAYAGELTEKNKKQGTKKVAKVGTTYNYYKNSTTGYKKNNDVEQRGMIRRDATKTLFIPKGQWMLGAQVGWQEWDTNNLNYLLLKDLNFQGHTFSVGPTVGYFFTKNMAVGARFSYKRNYFDVGGIGLNLGDDLTFSMNNYGYLQHSYKSTAFLRSYIPIGDSKIFGLFGEFQLNYTYSEGKNGTGLDEMFTGVYESVSSVGVGLAGGLVVFLTDFAAAEVMLNVGDCDYKWGKQNINNMEQGSLSCSGANFRIDLFSIKFGLTFYL